MRVPHFTHLLTASSCAAAYLVSSSASLAGLDTEPLTYNKGIWETSPQLIAQKFPVYDWKAGDKGELSSKSSDLEFMGMSIQSVTLHSSPQGTNALEFLIFSPEANGAVTSSKFSQATLVWKQLIDRNTAKVGKRMPTIENDGTTERRTSWEFDDSVAVLSAKTASTPQSLTLTLYSKVAGTAYLNSDTDKKVAGSSEVLKQLKGKTSLLDGRRYKKQEIGGDPEYFLLYYSASW